MTEIEALRRNDARYRAVLLASAAIVWIASPEGEFVEQQPIWQEYTGQTWEEYQGLRWISAIHPEDRAQVMADWMEAVRSGGPLRRTQVYRTQGRIWSAVHRDWRAFQTRVVPVRDAQGRTVEWVGALTDMQDAVDAQNKLAQRERELAETRSTATRVHNQLRRLLESNIIGIISTRDYEIVAANDAFLRMIGRSRADLAREPINWRAITPTGYEKRDACAMAQLRERGECRPFEKEYFRADGSRLPLLIGAVALRGNEGYREPLECVCFAVDITAQKEAEAALDQARAVAVQASEEKTRFLAAASHDLRQPLQALAALISMLAARPHEASETALIGRADRAIRSLADLLDALLDFSQLEAGVVRPNLQDFPIERLLDAMREEFEIAAAEKNLGFAVDACAGWIRSDPALLARIIGNLVSNAVKYTPPGGAVRIECRDLGDRLAIDIADTGIGIPAEMHALVFEEFRQIGNPERDHRKGLGLGLSIVAKMAQLLGHDVTLRSAPGSGSTFSVNVPTVAPASVAVPEAAGLAGGQRILLADDDELVAAVLHEMLTVAGYDVVTVNAADEALRAIAAAEVAFDAVISDFRLPKSSGLDVIEAARRRWPSAAAIILSGDIFHPKLQGLSARGIRLLRKPVTRKALAEALADCAETAIGSAGS